MTTFYPVPVHSTLKNYARQPYAYGIFIPPLGALQVFGIVAGDGDLNLGHYLSFFSYSIFNRLVSKFLLVD